MTPQVLTPVVLVCNEEYWLPYVLEASRGFFRRYVIYDVGSTDRTREIIDWFTDTNQSAVFRVRYLPMVSPVVQGPMRNSMVQEALSPYYLVLDGDEVYTPEGFESLIKAAETMRDSVQSRLYGIVRRQEWTGDLKSAYGISRKTPHHRIYDRSATYFSGPHPGERPEPPITTQNERWFPEIVCHHFHHAARSPQDCVVPGRFARKDNATYHRGETEPADLLAALPILRKPIGDFAVCPALAELQKRCASA